MKNPQGFFSRTVWELAVSIPPGKVTTYGILAKRAGGGAQAARSITGILSKAPDQSSIPYHRIVYANGRVWMAPEYEAARNRLYRKEGIKLNKGGYIENFEEVLWDFG